LPLLGLRRWWVSRSFSFLFLNSGSQPCLRLLF
jgi:hypothetical protein